MRALPDFVLTYVGIAVSLSLVWFAVRDRPGSATYRWAAPRVAALRVWVSRAPATFVYVAIWTATSILAQGQPLTISELVARYASTNLYNFHSEPFRTLVASSFLVADNGLFYPVYVAGFFLVAARLEHRVGSAILFEPIDQVTDLVGLSAIHPPDRGEGHLSQFLCAGHSGTVAQFSKQFGVIEESVQPSRCVRKQRDLLLEGNIEYAD